jgi:protein TonB
MFMKVAAFVSCVHLALIFALLRTYPQPHSEPAAETLIRLGAIPLVGQIASERASASKQSAPSAPIIQTNPAAVLTQRAQPIATQTFTPPAPLPATAANQDHQEAQNVTAEGSKTVSAQQRNNLISEPDFKAAYLNNPKPPYPRMAVRQHVQGTVILTVRVLPDGRAGDVRIDQSSGNSLLDDSALNTVKSWRFTPARQGGVAVAAEVRVPIVFSLN